MLKKILIIFTICISFFGFANATEEILEESKEALGINAFIKEAENYSQEAFPDLDISNMLNLSIKGELDLDFIKKAVIRIIGEEVVDVVEIIVTVAVIIIINSICKAVIQNLGNEETSNLANLLQYLLISLLVISSFANVLVITKATINRLAEFMNLLIPLFITLMLTTGSIVSTNIIQPILIFSINFMSNFVNLFLIPLLLVSCVISVASNISDKVQISGFAKFLKSSVVWILGIVLTLFTCMLSLEGTLGASIDGITAKTAKATVSNFIPVVGKILGDTVETVLGCANILKNTVGFIGVLIILGISLAPIIKLTIFTVCFKLTASVGEVVADSKIIKLVSEIADSYKILLGIVIAMSVMFIIGITLVLKITNSSLMYR